MSNLALLKKRITEVNSKGVESLAEKGVVLSENATTCDIVNAISLINSPSGDNGIAFSEADGYKRPTVVDLRGWTPASFGDNGSVYVSSKTVPAHAFYNGNSYGMFTAVKRFILPEGINAVSNQGFYYCNRWVYSADDFDMSELIFIGDKAFAYCTSLGIASLNLPKLKRMGSEAFSGVLASNNSLVTGEVVLGSPGNPVEGIGSSAFKYQSNITSITVYTENGAELASENSDGWGSGVRATYLPA